MDLGFTIVPRYEGRMFIFLDLQRLRSILRYAGNLYAAEIIELADESDAFIGSVEISPLTDPDQRPCIPFTWQVDKSAISPLYMGEGKGKEMYLTVLSYLTERGEGLTSDHGSLTSPSAQRVWDALVPYVSARRTEDGNARFDYSLLTPDLWDDCLGRGAYIDKSYELRPPVAQKMAPQTRAMERNTKTTLSLLPTRKRAHFLELLVEMAEQNFADQYGAQSAARGLDWRIA